MGSALFNVRESDGKEHFASGRPWTMSLAHHAVIPDPAVARRGASYKLVQRAS